MMILLEEESREEDADARSLLEGCSSDHPDDDDDYSHASDTMERRRTCLLFPKRSHPSTSSVVKKKHFLKQYQQPKQNQKQLSWKKQNIQQTSKQQPQSPEAAMPMLGFHSLDLKGDLEVQLSSLAALSSSSSRKEHSPSCFQRWNSHKNNSNSNQHPSVSFLDDDDDNEEDYHLLRVIHKQQQQTSPSRWNDDPPTNHHNDNHNDHDNHNEATEALLPAAHNTASDAAHDTSSRSSSSREETQKSSDLSQQLLLEHIRSEFSNHESPPNKSDHKKQKHKKSLSSSKPKRTTTYAQFDAQSSAALAIATSEQFPLHNNNDSHATSMVDESSFATASISQQPITATTGHTHSVQQQPPASLPSPNATAPMPDKANQEEHWNFPALDDAVWNTESSTLQLRTTPSLLQALSPKHHSQSDLRNDQEMPPPPSSSLNNNTTTAAVSFLRSNTEEESLVDGDCPVPWTPQRIQQKQSLYRSIRRQQATARANNHHNTTAVRQISSPPSAPPIPQQHLKSKKKDDGTRMTPFTASIQSTRQKICAKNDDDAMMDSSTRTDENDNQGILLDKFGAAPILMKEQDDHDQDLPTMKPDPPTVLPDDSFCDESFPLEDEEDKPYNPDESLLARADEIIQSVKRQIQSDIQEQIKPSTTTSAALPTEAQPGGTHETHHGEERIVRMLPQAARTAGLISPTTVSFSSESRYYPSRNSLFPTRPPNQKPMVVTKATGTPRQTPVQVVTAAEANHRDQPPFPSFPYQEIVRESEYEDGIRWYYIPGFTTADDHDEMMWGQVEV